VRLANRYRRDLSEITSLDLLSVSGPRGNLPFSALAKIELKPEVASLPRFNGRRMNEVQAYLEAGILPAQALSELRRELDAGRFQIPLGYELEFGGEAAKRSDAIGNLLASVGVLIVLMIATLVLSLGSFRLTVCIASIGVMSVGLGLLALCVSGQPFGFMAIVGTMGLIGIAINDAIVVLVAIRRDAAARSGDSKAIVDVVMENTRHVLATTLTTIAGFLPLVLSGSAFWAPLAIAIAGGVGGATVLSLFFGPSAYQLMMCRNRCARTEESAPSVPVKDSPVSEPVAVSVA
jgi:multidrug efflux pump subunit AcrB